MKPTVEFWLLGGPPINAGSLNTFTLSSSLVIRQMVSNVKCTEAAEEVLGRYRTGNG